MVLDYDAVKTWAFPEQSVRCDASASILYALSLGLGDDVAIHARSLNYVYEKQLRVLPTFAVTLGFPGSWMSDPSTGIDYKKVVHGEQRLSLHRPLRPDTTLQVRNRIAAIVDKGPGRGALVLIERVLAEGDGSSVVASMQQVTFCRGDGGFSAGGALPDTLPAPLPRVPELTPDTVHTATTRTDMALLYRLSGDRNPLHADPHVAAAAGFPRPILHGLATYGLACKALLATVCDGDETQIAEFSARFSAPMYPGESLETQIWLAGTSVHFRCRAVERDQIVLDNGIARLRD
jgi:acyl dehydratase